MQRDEDGKQTLPTSLGKVPQGTPHPTCSPPLCPIPPSSIPRTLPLPQAPRVQFQCPRRASTEHGTMARRADLNPILSKCSS